MNRHLIAALSLLLVFSLVSHPRPSKNKWTPERFRAFTRLLRQSPQPITVSPQVIHYAIKRCDIEGLRILVEYAERHNNPQHMRSLMNRQTGPHKNTSLHCVFAASRPPSDERAFGFVEDLIRFLVQHHADRLALNVAGETAFDIAQRKGWPESILNMLRS